MFTFISIKSCHFLEPNIIANADADFATFRFKDSERVASRQRVALTKSNFSFNIDIEQMHL